MMNSKRDFTALQQLLALHREEVHSQAQQADLNRFLQELHRRQRAKLLVPVSPWVYAVQWCQHRVEGFEHLFAGFRPALAYASGGAAFAALALAALFCFTPQIQLNGASSQNVAQVSFHLPGGATPTVALFPTAAAALNFSEEKLGHAFGSASQFAVATPRFVLDTHAAYDARAAF